YYTALTLASVSLVAMLLYLYPALVHLLAAVLLRERLYRDQLEALGLALGGALLTIGRVGGRPPARGRARAHRGAPVCRDRRRQPADDDGPGPERDHDGDQRRGHRVRGAGGGPAPAFPHQRCGLGGPAGHRGA